MSADDLAPAEWPSSPGPGPDPRGFDARRRGGKVPRGLRFVLWMVVVAVAGIAGFGFLQADDPVLAFPLAVRGAVKTSRSGREESRPLSTDRPLAAGTRFKVSPGSAVVLLLVPGIAAEADGPADFSLDELTMRKRGIIVESRRAVLTVQAGRVRCAVVTPPDRLADLRIATPAGVVECSLGSLVSVAVASDAVRVVCAWGNLRWLPGGDSQHAGTTILLPGEFCERADASATDRPRRQIIEDADAQEETAEMLRTATAISALEEARRLRSRPFSPPVD